VLLAWFAAPMMSAAVTPDRYVAYSGTATLPHSTEFLYGEQNVLHYRDGRLAERVTLYTCRSGRPFARKTVVYADPLAPDFLLEDTSTGLREGVRSEGGARVVFFRRVRVEPEKSSPVPMVPGLVVDAGFDEFIRTHWDGLAQAKGLDMRFLVPSRLESLNFQVQRVRADTIDGIAVEVFRLKFTGVLGLVLPGIDVSYSADDHVLMGYEGLSDLRDAAGNNFRISILFHSIDRRMATEEENSAARQAPLGLCK